MQRMSQLVLAGAFMISSITPIAARASNFDDEVDAREAAEAVANCADEAKGLTGGGVHDYISSVTAKHKKVSERVDTKQYVIEASTGGGFAPPMKSATLIVDLKITQPPSGAADMPAYREWKCTLKKD